VNSIHEGIKFKANHRGSLDQNVEANHMEESQTIKIEMETDLNCGSILQDKPTNDFIKCEINDISEDVDSMEYKSTIKKLSTYIHGNQGRFGKYECKVCEYKASNKSNLNKHVKRIHN